VIFEAGLKDLVDRLAEQLRFGFRKMVAFSHVADETGEGKIPDFVGSLRVNPIDVPGDEVPKASSPKAQYS